jgi:hypothetical protein
MDSNHSQDHSQIHDSEFGGEEEKSGYFDEEGNYWKYEQEEEQEGEDPEEDGEGEEEEVDEGHKYMNEGHEDDEENPEESQLNNFSEEDFSVKEEMTEKSMSRSEGGMVQNSFFKIYILFIAKVSKCKSRRRKC